MAHKVDDNTFFGTELLELLLDNNGLTTEDKTNVVTIINHLYHIASIKNMMNDDNIKLTAEQFKSYPAVKDIFKEQITEFIEKL